jgi:hypothetical protein
VPWRPRNRLAAWWLRSRLFDALYTEAAVAGAGLFLLTATAVTASWPSDWILLSPERLDAAAPWLFLPGLPVGVLSLIAFGRWDSDQPRDHPFFGWTVRDRVVAGAVLAVLLAVVGGCFIVGTDKGASRVLPGPRYEVMILSGGGEQWKTVTAPEYRRWRGRLLREDSGLCLFGAFELGLGAAFIRFRRRTRREAS